MRAKVLVISLILAFSSTFVQAAEVIGLKFFDQSLGANANVAVFTPTSNLNGAEIKTASVVGSNTGDARILAVFPDGTQRVLVIATSTNGGGGVTTVMPYPLYLPAGVGLSVSTAGMQGAAFITYNLL